jgi:hypothetical protein
VLVNKMTRKRHLQNPKLTFLYLPMNFSSKSLIQKSQMALMLFLCLRIYDEDLISEHYHEVIYEIVCEGSLLNIMFPHMNLIIAKLKITL